MLVGSPSAEDLPRYVAVILQQHELFRTAGLQAMLQSLSMQDREEGKGAGFRCDERLENSQLKQVYISGWLLWLNALYKYNMATYVRWYVNHWWTFLYFTPI